MTIKEQTILIQKQTAAIARIREEMLAELAQLEADEPECECAWCGPDEMDPSYCEYHRGDSEWNCDVRRVERAIAELDADLASVRKPVNSESNNERKVA